MEIYLIRHGQSTGNDLKCFHGWGDNPLTDLGRSQAQAVALRLAPLGPLPVICSDLPRAVMTAEILAAQWNKDIQRDDRWREIGCGNYEGLPWDSLSQDIDLVKQFDADPYRTPMPGGESAAIMSARVQQAFDEASRRPEERLAIVTHDGPIRAVLAHCLQIPPERFWTLTTKHGGLTILTITDGWISVRTVNDTSHLP